MNINDSIVNKLVSIVLWLPFSYDPVSPTAPEQHSLTYVIDKPSILKIIKESAFCRQEVEYSCTVCHCELS